MNFQVVLFATLLIAVYGADRAERAPPKVPLKEADIYIFANPPDQFDVSPQDQNCTLPAIDLVMVVDESGSIGINNFNITLRFLGALSQSMIIGPAPDRSQVALVKFDCIPTVAFKLNTYSKNSQVYKAIIGSDYSGGGTNISTGMNSAINEVFTRAGGDRPNVSNVILLLTDGNDTSDVVSAQKAAVAKGINIFVIGVGQDVDRNQLLKIVGGDPAKVFNVSTFSGLDSILVPLCYTLRPITQPPTTRVATTQPPTTRVVTTQPPTTPVVTTHPTTGENGQCQHGGTIYCQCPCGYTGRYCETAINSCNNTRIFSQNDNVTVPLCGAHGTCHYDQNSGSYCVCDHGWTGPICDQPIPEDIHISSRCDFYYGSYIPNPNCTVGDRCVPDNIDCALSDSYCIPPAPGWCLPEAVAKSIFDTVRRRYL